MVDDSENDGSIIHPQFGLKIHILPGWFGPDICTHWTLRLLSMTLLVPQKPNPDYTLESLPDWRPVEVLMPSTEDAFDGPGGPGVRVTFDSCESAHSIPSTQIVLTLRIGSLFSQFPTEVVGQMRRTWLQSHDGRTPVESGADQSWFYAQNRGKFKGHDIIFKFVGVDEQVVDFRCDARDFLVSPWRTEHGHVIPLAEAPPSEWPGEPVRATLGLVGTMPL